MNIKLSTLVNSVESLKKLSMISLSASLSYKIAKTLIRAEEELKIFANIRTDLQKRLITDNKLSNQLEIDKQFNQEMNELLEKEVILPDFKIDIDDLKETSIEPAVLMNLEWFINE